MAAPENVVDQRVIRIGWLGNVVETPTGGFVEVQVSFDQDGLLRFHSDPGGGGGGAPTTAQYLVGASDATLSAERVVTDTATITWDLATAGQAKANVPNGSISTTQLGGDITSAGEAILTAANAAAQRALIDAQQSDALLGAIAALSMVADRYIYGTGTDTVALGTITSYIRTLLDDVDAAAARATLGLGSLSTIDGVLPIGDGGTGASTAPAARINLLPALSGNSLKVVRVNAGETDIEYLSLGSLATLSSVNDANWSGTDLAIANGGTGASTAQAAIDALTDVAGSGTPGQVLLVSGAEHAVWGAPSINNANWSGTDLAVTNGGTGASDAATARTNLGAAASGAATASGLTLATARVLGRATAGTGAIEELSAGTGLGITGGTIAITDAELTSIAGLTSAADRLPYYTGSGTAALATFTAAGRALVDDADASAQRTTLGLGTLATLSRHIHRIGFGGWGSNTYTSQPSTQQFWGGSNSHNQLTSLDAGYTQCRIVCKVNTAGHTTAKLLAMYRTSYSATATDYSSLGTSEVSVAISATGMFTSSWIDIAAGALVADVVVSLQCSGGNSTASPTITYASIEFR